MLRRLITSWLLVTYFAAPLFALPHHHGSEELTSGHQHQGQPHIHFHAAGSEAGDWHHHANSHSHGAPGTPESGPDQADPPANGDLLLLPEAPLADGKETGFKPVSGRKLLPLAPPFLAEPAHNSLSHRYWRPPAAICGAGPLFLRLRHLRL